LEEKVVRNTVLYAAASICPMTAFFGGIVAQEIVKFTGKYSPLKQWLHYDIFDSLPKEEVNRAPMGCRYDDQILVYGREVQEKLGKLNTFMVGAGALGCELIKAFACMGVGCSPQGQVSVTDNDNIEISNLNRQFLFRKNNVGHSKSECACTIAKDINPALNVKDYQTRVGSDTEALFNDAFWEKLDFVVNAVDNIKARLYVDSRCVWYAKPLLESGTLGTKANSQMIIPYKTQCYGDSQDPPEESIPMCTLRNFPNQIEHCIEWGRDLFSKFFFDTPNDAASYLDKPLAFVGQLKQNTTSSGVRSTIEEIKKLIDLKKEANFDKCLEIARKYFDEYFDHSIQNLLSIFPEDAKDKEGQPFWSGPKRAPHPVHYDAHDPLHSQFVTAAANLIAYTLGITQVRDVEYCARVA
jgi:ubiquitin-activating enzyme E1